MSAPAPSDAQLARATPSQLLLLSATLGRTDLAVSALRAGASVDALATSPPASPPASLPVSPYARTPLHEALSLGHVDATRALLAAGASLTARDTRGQTPLDVAAHDEKTRAALAAHVCQRAAAGDADRVADAVAAGWDVGRPDGSPAGNAPLHWAAAFGQLEAVRVLLEAGVHVDPVNARGDTPLRDAVAAAHVEVVRALVDAGADPRRANAEGSAPVDIARTDELLGALHRGGGERGGKPEEPEEPEAREGGEVPPETPYFVPGERVWAGGRGGERGGGEPPSWGRLLWPTPRRFLDAGQEAFFTVPPVVAVSAENQCMAIARRLVAWMREEIFTGEAVVKLVGGGHGGLGEALEFSASVFLRIDERSVEKGAEAYNITVRDFGIDVVGADLPGLFYGCSTLLNILQLRKRQATDLSSPLSIPACRISDWPSIKRRVLHMDISRHMLPKLETLEELVKFVARQMKMNQIQLNLGSNFTRMSDLTERDAMRHEDILSLQSICQQHFVELVPVVSLPTDPTKSALEKLHVNANGNSDSHLDNERKKAQSDHEMIYDEFLTLFDSPQVNLGDLSESENCDTGDFERLRIAARDLRSRGKQTFQVFGTQVPNTLADSPVPSSVLAEIPTRCITILEADLLDEDKYRESCDRMSQFGLPFFTSFSSHLEDSLAGCTSKALHSSWVAIETALEHGAVGVMMKNASSATHNAPLVFLYQTLISFAGAAWNAKQVVGKTSSGPDDVLSHLYDTYIFRDPIEKGILGNIALSLGELHKVAGDSSGKALPRLLTNPRADPTVAIDGMTYLGLRRALKRAERIENALASYVGNANHTDILEMRVSAILLGVSARLGTSLFSISSAASMDSVSSLKEGPLEIGAVPDGRRSDLCNALLHSIELLREAWMKRYVEEGFTATVELLAGEAMTQLAHGMPYQRYLEERKAHGWAPGDE